MNIVTKILAVLTALEFLYIFYLETLATDSAKTSSVFGMTQEELRQKNVNVLFKNQGVYNGLIAVMIFLAVFVLSDVLYHWRGSLWQHHQQSKDYPDAGRSGHPDIDISAVLMMVSRRMPAFLIDAPRIPCL